MMQIVLKALTVGAWALSNHDKSHSKLFFVRLAPYEMEFMYWIECNEIYSV